MNNVTPKVQDRIEEQETEIVRVTALWHEAQAKADKAEYWKNRAEYYEQACLKLYEATRDLIAFHDRTLPPGTTPAERNTLWTSARAAIAFANLGPYLSKYGSTLPEALKEWEDLHGRD